MERDWAILSKCETTFGRLHLGSQYPISSLSDKQLDTRPFILRSFPWSCFASRLTRSSAKSAWIIWFSHPHTENSAASFGPPTDQESAKSYTIRSLTLLTFHNLPDGIADCSLHSAPVLQGTLMTEDWQSQLYTTFFVEHRQWPSLLAPSIQQQPLRSSS